MFNLFQVNLMMQKTKKAICKQSINKHRKCNAQVCILYQLLLLFTLNTQIVFIE